MSLPLLAADAQVYAQVSAAFGLSGRQRGKATAEWIESAVHAASAILERDECASDLSEALELYGIPAKNLYSIASLVLCNALLMHKRLLGAVDIPGASRLDGIVRSASPADDLIRSWKQVLKRDYAPIFAPALAVLLKLRSGPNANEAIGLLADVAETVADSLNDMGYDHAGPLYHRILPSAKSDGAFYTNNVSAVLLSRLALDDSAANWSDYESICRLKIADPACGTGTLLMAALKSIKDKGLQHGGIAEGTLENAHKRLVTSCIHGMDVNWHAVQLAASNLTLGAPTVDYGSMHLHALRHGPSEQGAKTGSLELIPDLVADRKPDLLDASRTVSLAHELAGKEADGEASDLRDMDVVMMNPPFTINTVSGSAFGAKGQLAMRAREDQIQQIIRRTDKAAAAAITRKSLATFFSPLADYLVRPDQGVLAKIIPFAACTSSTGEAERRFLADRFEISIVVTSHAKQSNFSDSTNIHECLVVCRRKAKRDRSDTLFVSLAKMPQTADEAIEVADSILTGCLEREWGRCCLWPLKRVEMGDWSAAQWMDDVLAETAREMPEWRGLRPLGDLANVGPAHVRSELRNPLSDPSEGPYRVLWRHVSRDRRTMQTSHEFSVAEKPGKKRDAERAWVKASRLLIANKLSTHNVSVAAVLLDTPAVGSVWTAVTPKLSVRETDWLTVQQAWCAWFNSTLGVIAFMHRRGRILTYPDFMPNKIKSLPCPDPSVVDLEPLIAAYNAHKERQLLPWPRMVECPVRAALDDAAADVVQLDRKELADWRRRLSQEPTIEGFGV